MKAHLSVFERKLPQSIHSGVETHSSRTSIALALSDDAFTGVAEIAPQGWSVNGDASVDDVLEHLERIAIPRFLSVRARNAHHPFWAQIPALFGNDSVSRSSAALIEGALYDGEVRQAKRVDLVATAGIATGSLVGTPYIPLVTEAVSLVRIKLSPLVDPRAFDALQSLACPVVLDYNASGPTSDQVREHVALASVHTSVSFVEQIGTVGDFTAHYELQDSGIRLSLDESIRSMQDIRNVIRYGAASVVCIKPARVGGRSIARTMIEEALEQGLTPYIGGFFETALGRFANAELVDQFNLGPSDILMDGRMVTNQDFDTTRTSVLANEWSEVGVFGSA
ncbi:MAG: enolase C-terminal domain-like protein [Actinomycetes bacterium]